MMKKREKQKGRHEAPRQKLVPGRSRESVCRRNGIKLDMILLSLLFFAVGVLHLSGIGILDARNQEIAYLERQRQSLVTENERTRLIISQMDTLENVEQRAREELGMVRAEAGDHLVVALRVPGAEDLWPHGELAADASGDAETSKGHLAGTGLLQTAQESIQGILKRWNF